MSILSERHSMIAPVFKGEGKLSYEEIADPIIENGDDVIVDTIACGICGTDLNILAVPSMHSGKSNIVIGHEAVGRVRAVGANVTGLKPGDRVAIAPRLTCGICEYCRMGYNNQCTNYTTVGTTRHGAFAPQIVLPRRALYTLSDSVSLNDALFFEPLSCVVGAMKRVPFMPGDAVLIIGGGPIGMLFALLCRAMGARHISIADLSPKRLRFAREHQIADVIDVSKEDVGEAIRNRAPLGADIVVDAVGNQMNVAVTCVRRAGHVILFGLRAHDTPEVRQYAITRYDVTVHGVFVGLNPFVDTVRILESGVLKPSTLITHTLPLEQLAKGVELMRNADAMKVKITIGE